MAQGLTVPFLREIMPDGFGYGANYLVEFESDSLWYEISLMFVAEALRQGAPAEYHTFRHVPAEVRGGLQRLGLDVKRLEAEYALRIIDSYTSSTLELQHETNESRLPWGSRSLKVQDLRNALAEQIKKGSARRWEGRLHVDDDTSTLVPNNDEKSFVDFWRTTLAPHARSHGHAMIHSILTGAFSESLYKQLESGSDGILDIRSREDQEGFRHFIRLRKLRDSNPDTRWRQLHLDAKGSISIDPSIRPFHDLGIKSWLKGAKP